MRVARRLRGATATLILVASIASLFHAWKNSGISTGSRTGALSGVGLAPIGVVLFGVAVFILVNVCSALAWRSLVDSGRATTLSLGAALHIWMASNVGKYVPGNVMQYAGRYALGRSNGVGSARSFGTLIAEVASVSAVALLIGMPFLLDEQRLGSVVTGSTWEFLSPDSDQSPSLFLPFVVSTAVVCSACAMLLPRVRERAVLLLGRGVAWISDPTTRRAFARAALLHLTTFLLAGLAAHAVLTDLWAHDGPVDYATLTSVYALSFLLGFLLPGAPGGLGVREFAMVTLLSPLAGTGQALGLALSLRVCTVVADVAGALLARPLHRRVLDDAIPAADRGRPG